MSDHLNDDFFRRLNAKLPDFKKEAAKKFGEKKANAGRPPQPPCLICGKRFGSQKKVLSLTPENPVPNCPSCQKLLDEKFCAMVTLDGTRYAFVKSEVMPKEWAGIIKIVPDDIMDKIQGSQTRDADPEKN